MAIDDAAYTKEVIRSQWILDIEHDLRLISERLHMLEDHFEHDGHIARIAETVRQIAVDIEAIKVSHQGDDRADR